MLELLSLYNYLKTKREEIFFYKIFAKLLINSFDF